MESTQLKQVYRYAELWVKENHNNILGSKHLLLGLVCIPSKAQAVLARFGLTAQTYRVASERLGYSQRTLVVDSEVDSLKRRAVTISYDCDTDCVEPEHLLLAILADKNCYAYASLQGHGINIENLLAVTIEQIENNGVLLQKLFGVKITKSENAPLQQQYVKPESEQVKYCIDMTQKAQQGEFDPVIGRENEIARIVQTLVRRTKNNPLLIGEAGVGKSAVVEGLAQAIVDKTVPSVMQNKRILSLDVASMLAGTHYRGDFEQRLKDTIDECQKRGNVILFIDEIHNIVGAGASGDSNMDAVEILKPLLARGQIQVMGATTLDEYGKYIEKDPALERRFQPIVIEQPTVDQTISILQGVKDKYEAHHNLKIQHDAIVASAKLSARYIVDRNLPDKAFDVLDEACSAMMLKGKNLVTFDDVATVVSQWTGIPVGKMTSDEKNKILSLEEELKNRVIGQPHAVESVARAIKRQRAGISSPNRPIGSFIFVGPTGVGKTELAKALAGAMFSNENDILRFDMSEYMDKTSVSKLVGTSAGYEGYQDGGLLTERVRRKPYSVVLFDEIEKANPDIFNLMLQILDEGKLTDNRGRVVDFKNTVIIFTSNAGAHLVDPDQGFDELKRVVNFSLKNTFRPEFLNRLDEIVVFDFLRENDVFKITRLLCDKLCKRLNQIDLTITDDAVKLLAKIGYSKTMGVRPLQHVIRRTIEDYLSEKILSGQLREKDRIVVDQMNGKLCFI